MVLISFKSFALLAAFASLAVALPVDPKVSQEHSTASLESRKTNNCWAISLCK
ncbi:hypothetical protein BC628DRAFT_1421470 [Trametes gibbosa]|nr:hypothetical protein BC628DRAFT_1421470 [Trametes gibbosa]